MESQKLTFNKLLYCYKNLKKYRESMCLITVGKHLGYLEAGLVVYDYLETINNSGTSEIKRNLIKSTKWYKKDRMESYEQAIIRMIEKLFNDNNIKLD